jgi:hypothetical protein
MVCRDATGRDELLLKITQQKRRSPVEQCSAGYRELLMPMSRLVLIGD